KIIDEIIEKHKENKLPPPGEILMGDAKIEEMYSETIGRKLEKKATQLQKEIIERKQAEERLIDSESRLKKTEEIAHLGSWVVDIPTKRLIWSDEVYRIFGLQPKGLSPAPGEVLDAVHPEDRAMVDAAYSASLREGQDSYDIEYRIVRRHTGETRYIHERCEHIKDASGTFIRSVGMVQDITEQKRVQEELQIALVMYKTLFSAFPLGITVADRTGKILETNKMAERLLGLSQEEHQLRMIDGKEWTMVRPDGTPLTQQEYASVRALRENRTVENMEMGILKKGGEVAWINVTASPLPLKGGGVVITYNDITEQKKTQDALKESEEKFRGIFEQSPVAIEIYDWAGKLVEANRECLLLLGTDDIEEVKGFNIFEDPNVPVEVKKRLLNHEPVKFEYVLDFEPAGKERLHGTKKRGKSYLNINATPIWKEETPSGFLVHIRDITERKEAEMEREQFFKFFQISSDLMVISEPDGRFKKINPACMQMLGYSENELMEKPFIDFVHPDDRQRTIDEIALQLERGYSMNFENRYICKDGSFRWLSWRATYIKEENLTYATARDITERKQKEEALRASLEEKTVLLNEVHHRVKNNLQIVSSLLNLQAMRIKNKEAHETLLETGNRIHSMSLLHETIYRSGNMALVDFSSYIENICSHIIRSYESIAQNTKLELHLEETNLDLDRAVPCGLIINELVSNSLKHAFPDRRPGKITVELKALPDGNIMLTFADDGIGLPESVDISKTETLGLKLVSILTEQIKGSVEIFRDKGTAFHIKLRARTDK
ncbi:MAG TPA: PAS domain S-box protein, partial [Candidatus Methanoperedens sp.]